MEKSKMPPEANGDGQMVLPLVVVEPPAAVFSSPDLDDPEFLDWLHGWVMKQSLRHLSDTRVGEVETRDCLEWVQSESEAPFSFIQCCNVAEVDPTVMRAEALRQYRNRVKKEETHVLTKKEAAPNAAFLPSMVDSAEPGSRY